MPKTKYSTIKIDNTEHCIYFDNDVCLNGGWYSIEDLKRIVNEADRKEKHLRLLMTK